MRFIPVILSCFLLAACATPEQIEAQRQQQRQEDMNTCRGYGFRVNSDAFRNCLLQIDIARTQRRDNYYYGGYYGGGYPYRHGIGGTGYLLRY